MIKSIVLNQAIFQEETRNYDPEDNLGKTLKSGAYKEEFIRSIVNKSGVFVKEFREISDPYSREEFIMSIHMLPAEFSKITSTNEFEVYNATIQKSVLKSEQKIDPVKRKQ